MAEAGKIHSPPPGRQKERPDQRLSIIGTRMLRKEDPRFLAGRGRFIDDITLPNMAHAAALRSPHAHARIRGISVPSQAVNEAGGCVFTAADLPRLQPIRVVTQAPRARPRRSLASSR